MARERIGIDVLADSMPSPTTVRSSVLSRSVVRNVIHSLAPSPDDGRLSRPGEVSLVRNLSAECPRTGRNSRESDKTSRLGVGLKMGLEQAKCHETVLYVMMSIYRSSSPPSDTTVTSSRAVARLTRGTPVLRHDLTGARR